MRVEGLRGGGAPQPRSTAAGIEERTLAGASRGKDPRDRSGAPQPRSTAAGA